MEKSQIKYMKDNNERRKKSQGIIEMLENNTGEVKR